MEQKKRTWTKAFTWQLIGFVVMTVINYVYMGSFQSGLGLSTLLTSVGLVTYYLHERAWSHLSWGVTK
ncbi:DUF2061 domain-containing protein [Comamonadaceae bacterium M7527]|nr:DUF2061 domain-containing protein [Comamonadaceae bacterium M7527]